MCNKSEAFIDGDRKLRKGVSTSSQCSLVPKPSPTFCYTCSTKTGGSTSDSGDDLEMRLSFECNSNGQLYALCMAF